MSFSDPILLALKSQYRILVNHGKIFPRYRIFLLLLLPCQVSYMNVKYLCSLGLNFALCKMKYIRTCHRIKWTGRVYIFKIWPQYTSCQMLIYDVIFLFQITHKYVRSLTPPLDSSRIVIFLDQYNVVEMTLYSNLWLSFYYFTFPHIHHHSCLNILKKPNDYIDKWPKDIEILSTRLQMNSCWLLK